MGTQQSILARRVAAAGLVLVLAQMLALAQDKGRVPFESAFSSFARTWATKHVPDPSAFSHTNTSLGELFSAKSIFQTRRLAIATTGRLDRPVFRLNAKQQRNDDGTNWAFGRPLDGFSSGFDAFGNPTIGPADVQAQARNYVKQRIINEILSKTAFGRSLAVFVDSGRHGLDPNRSRLLPFISPKVNLGEGKVAMTVTWKF